jgi:hypothetical protein
MPRLPFMPLSVGGMGGLFKFNKKSRGTKAKYGYSASLEANLFKIRGRVNPLLAKTGLVLRPLKSRF